MYYSISSQKNNKISEDERDDSKEKFGGRRGDGTNIRVDARINKRPCKRRGGARVDKRITRDRGHKGKGRVDRRREDK